MAMNTAVATPVQKPASMAGSGWPRRNSQGTVNNFEAEKTANRNSALTINRTINL